MYEGHICDQRTSVCIKPTGVDAIVIEGDRIDLMEFLTRLKGLKLEEKLVAPIIIISDVNDFELQALYFDLGIMSFMCYENFEAQRFLTYLYAIKRDKEALATLRGYRLAVVDDSKLSLAVLKDYFKILGIHEVDYYQSSKEFMEGRQSYQMVILDLVMPQYSGEDLIYYIRSHHSKTIILLMSAYSDSPVISHCLNIGADDFILKPLDFKLFTMRVFNAISNYILTEENMVMNQRLYDLATRDSLTGAYNRTYFIEYFDKRLSELRRKYEDFCMILIDIDHFKMVNDDFGHMRGDEVLYKVAQTIEEGIRESDVLCRWGGEEFVVLLPNTAIENAAQVGEKLRSSLAGTNFGLGRPLTISLGVSEYRPGDYRESLFKRLDNSLYLAKLTGRNKVVVNEELQIMRSGLPVSIEWGPFFKSGHKDLDLDHQRLISFSNDIIVNCFRSDNADRVNAMFKSLMDEIGLHFENEEGILAHHGYDKLEDHKKIHRELVEKTALLYASLLSKKVSPVNLAKYLIQEVVVGHIIKSDFEFFDALRS